MDISIICATNNIERFNGFIESLDESLEKPELTEVIVKVDKEDSQIIEAVGSLNPKVNLRMHIGNKEGGYWDLWKFYNRMSFESCGRILIGLNDSVRFSKCNWDASLMNDYSRMLKQLPDGIFTFRASSRRNHPCKTLGDCMAGGEWFLFQTREYVRLIGGIAVDRGCVDTGQEILNFVLQHYHGIYCSYVFNGFKVANEMSAVSESEGVADYQAKYEKIKELYKWLMSDEYMQIVFSKAYAIASALGHKDEYVYPASLVELWRKDNPIWL